MERKPDTVTFTVETTRNTVVDINGYVEGLALTREAGKTGNWLAANDGAAMCGRAVKQEIPEDRVTPRLVAVAVWAEGEFIAEYSAENPLVVEFDDRVAIVIAAEAAGINIPDGFSQPGLDESDPDYQRLFVDQSDAAV